MDARCPICHRTLSLSPQTACLRRLGKVGGDKAHNGISIQKSEWDGLGRSPIHKDNFESRKEIRSCSPAAKATFPVPNPHIQWVKSRRTRPSSRWHQSIDGCEHVKHTRAGISPQCSLSRFTPQDLGDLQI